MRENIGLLEQFDEKHILANGLRRTLAVSHLSRKFNQDQPRVPAGSADGGQWTRDDGSISSTQFRSSLAAMSTRADCEAQWLSNIFHRNMVGLSACYAQAMVRLVACEKGQTIPLLNY
ncbi:MAG: hypothetical protein ACRECC_08690 [Pseudolabrys sp.]